MSQPDHPIVHATQQLNTFYQAFSVSLFKKPQKAIER